MGNIKMPLNTLRKDGSKHFSGRASGLASVKLPFETNK